MAAVSLVIAVLSVAVIALAISASDRQKQIAHNRDALAEQQREISVLSQQLRDAGIKPSPLASPTANINIHLIPSSASTTVTVPMGRGPAASTTTTTRPATTTTTTTRPPPTTTTTRPRLCTSLPAVEVCP